MMAFYAPEVHDALEDYGCVGRGHLDSSSQAAGVPKDGVDAGFLWWKKCIHCAKVEYNNLTIHYNADDFSDFYQFDEIEDQICCKYSIINDFTRV